MVLTVGEAALLAAAAAAAAGFWLWMAALRPARRREEALRAELMSAREALSGAEARAERLAGAEAEAERLRAALGEARGELERVKAQLETERGQHAARLEELRKAEERISTQFRSLAQEALGSNSKRFLELVSERFESHRKTASEDLEKRQTAIDQMVKPLHETLEKFDARVGEIEKARQTAYAQIREQVEALKINSESLRGETSRLVQALRAPKTRGRWGELQLRQVFEMAGMVEHVDYLREATMEGEEGRLRPDAVVRLPGGKSIVVDAKTPLEGYLNAVEAADPQTQAAALADHARQLRTHVRQLSAKEYWARLDHAPDFVVMFVPGEAMYSAAIEKDPALFEDAFNRRVLISTPTTLIALVKAIAYGWQQEKLAENAQAVAANARDLYDRLSVMGGHLDKLGRSIHRSVEAYNRTVGSLEGRVLPAARRFEQLQVVRPDSSLEGPAPVEAEPRSISASELLGPAED